MYLDDKLLDIAAKFPSQLHESIAINFKTPCSYGKLFPALELQDAP